MKLWEFIPFLNGEEVEAPRQGEYVRYLTKFEDNGEIDIDKFNHYVGEALAQMNKARKNKKARIRSGIKENIDQDYLQRNHLTYEIQLGEEAENEGDSDKDMGEVTGKTTFSVILREQPTKAIEISGPKLVASQYKEAMEEILGKEGKKVDFSSLVKD